ncbi:MAG TPA: VOC family protein [Pseudonocardia sp.]|jgi:uncharacterized glyoxalase superfamily protein PhnB|nr:VOC family protein [Pseudonocardia sp.]
MTSPEPMIWPTLTYHDAPAALTFLTEVFGFRTTLLVPDDNGDVPHAELRWPEGGGVMVSSAKHCEGIINPGTGSAYVVTDHVDDVHGRCVAAGATVTQPLEDTDYGSHTFTVRDPEGNTWVFGTYRGT